MKELFSFSFTVELLFADVLFDDSMSYVCYAIFPVMFFFPLLFPLYS